MIPSNIKSYYKLHSKFYDSTRWAFLFGRNSLPDYFPELEPDSKILDVGCGTGKHLGQLLEHYPEARIIGIDQSEEMLRFVNRSIVDSVEVIHESYSKDSFEKNSFDLILCSYSLTMFDDIEEAVQNIKSHLKPNGKLLIVDFDSTPFKWFRKWMKRNHVSFEPNLVERLSHEFPNSTIKTKLAYLGLYSYSIFVRAESLI